jgi:hypothetical protein
MDERQQGLNLSRGQRAKIADPVPNARAFAVGVAANTTGLVIDPGELPAHF